MQNQTEKNQEIFANIEIARANLYVFGNSNEKNKWHELLDKAKLELINNPIYSAKILERVNNVIDATWKRIHRWHELQKKLVAIFIIAIIVELISTSIYFHSVDIVINGFFSSILFGLLGGTLGVALNLGKGIQIAESNRLSIMKLILRPFIGSIAALVLYSLLQLKVLTVLPELNQTYVIIILSIFAGYSEKFITKAMNDYIPKLISDKKE